MRKGEQAKDEMVKDVNGQIFRDGVLRRRQAEYSEQVLNVADDMKSNINLVGNWQIRCWEILMKENNRWTKVRRQ